MQLPPSLSFDAAVVTAFLEGRARVYDGPVGVRAETCDLVLAAGSSILEGTGFHEWRPIRRRCRMQACRRAGPASPIFGCTAHRASTGRDTTRTYIATLAATVRSIATAGEVWCVFDNTASGAAIENAWELRERVTGTARLSDLHYRLTPISP